MAKITTSSDAKLTVKVNNANSIYSVTSQNTDITIYTINTTVASDSIAKETNFLISDDPSNNPDTIIPATLTLTYPTADITEDSFIGFRISAAAAQPDFTFTTDSTEFTVPETLPTIALSTAEPTADSVIWQKSDAELTGTVNIQINYTGTSLPSENNPLLINVDLFEVDALTDWTTSNNNTISEDTEAVPLQVQVVTAELTAPITSHNDTDLSTLQTSFRLNDKIVLKNALTTNTAENYKPVNALTFTENINKAIGLSYLYISTEEASSIAENKLYDNTPAEIDSAKYAAIDISALETTPVNGLTYTSDTSNNTIAIDMSAIDDTAKFFTDGVLASQLFVYFEGTIVSSAK